MTARTWEKIVENMNGLSKMIKYQKCGLRKLSWKLKTWKKRWERADKIALAAVFVWKRTFYLKTTIKLTEKCRSCVCFEQILIKVTILYSTHQKYLLSLNTQHRVNSIYSYNIFKATYALTHFKFLIQFNSSSEYFDPQNLDIYCYLYLY